MELGIVAALAYWGIHTGHNVTSKAALGIGAPAAGFGFWGAVDFRQAGHAAEPLRLGQELIISGLAALALFVAGLHVLGIALLVLTIAYHGLVYAMGRRLLNPALPSNAGGFKLEQEG